MKCVEWMWETFGHSLFPLTPSWWQKIQSRSTAVAAVFQQAVGVGTHAIAVPSSCGKMADGTGMAPVGMVMGGSPTRISHRPVVLAIDADYPYPVWPHSSGGSPFDSGQGHVQADKNRHFTGYKQHAHTGEEEQSSSLVNSKMGRSYRIWGVQVNERSGGVVPKRYEGVE
ncbi:hypothetical protein B0H14DRAFT_3138222 [Mycena olivaceomarginata]|nr:hypothetical protein B0H14DRAFT_3138222 [Mycena olivaceomarginata]